MNTTSGGTSTAAAATSVKINSGNTADVSAYSYSAMEDVNSTSGYGSSAVFATGVSVDAAVPTGVLQRALQQMYLGLGARPNTQLATGVSTTETVACSGGGSITVSVNVAGTNQAQNGAMSFSGDSGLTGNSPTLGNVTFTVKTTAPFKTTAGSMNPYTGSATVTAADGSSTSYTALDSSNVRIDVDSNGDGVIDSTSNSTWATFRSRI